MRGQRRTLDKIIDAFAESVSAGELEKAEGWLALALWSQDQRRKSFGALQGPPLMA